MSQVLSNPVGPIGFGLMGFTWRPNPTPIDQAVDVVHEAVESGCTLLSGAEFYGPPTHNSLHLLKAFLAKYPQDSSKVTLLIKGGTDVTTMKPMGKPEDIRASIDRIIAPFQDGPKVDIVFCIARRDQSVPFVDTLQTIQKEYIDTGKIKGVAVSECGPETIHEAVKHVKVAVAEVELSMFTPDVMTNGVAAACKEHNIPIVAYSPIGRGMLTGQFRKAADVEYLGRLSGFPRLQEDAIQHNLQLVDKVEALAKQKGCTPAQLAINWVRMLGRRSDMPTVIPIPGTTGVERLHENAKIINLDADDLKAIDDLLAGFEIKGRRYPAGVPLEL